MKYDNESVVTDGLQSLGTQIFESSPDCVKLLHGDGKIFALNRNGYCAMEIDEFSQILGMPWKALWPVKSHAEIDKAIADAFNGETGRFSAFCPTAKGTPKWWDVIVTMVPGQDGCTECLLAVSRDVTAAHYAALEMKTSEARYRSLITATAAIVWNTPASVQFETVQSGWALFTGQTFNEYRGWGWLDAVHADDQAETAASWKRASESGTLYETEHRLRRADGQYRHMSVRGVPLVDEHGAIYEWVGIHSDITESVLAKAERENFVRHIKSANERLVDVFRQAPAFMCLLAGPSHVFELVNNKYLQLVGNRDLVGQAIRDALPEVAGQGFFELLDKVFQTGETFVGTDMHILLQREPGAPMEERYLDLVYVALRNPDGAVTGILVHGVDQTERKRAEIDLFNSRERLQKIVSQAATGVVEADSEGRIAFVNRKYCDMLGYTEAELLGLNISDVTAPDSVLLTSESIGKLAAGGSDVVIEKQCLRKDGTLMWATSSVGALRCQAGQFQGIVAIVLDITESKLADDELRRHAGRQAFQLEMTESLSRLSEPEEVTAVASESLGRKLNVSRVAYAVVDSPSGTFIVQQDWTSKGMASLTGQVRQLDDFGPEVTDALRAGIVMVVDDIAMDPRTAIHAEAYASLGVRSYMVIPLVKARDLIAMLYIHNASPHHWTAQEIAFAQYMVTSTSASVERAIEAKRRHRAEAELREANRHKDDFLAMLAHELRNPLAPIGAAAELLQMSTLDSKYVRKTSEVIVRQVKHMTHLIDDLLDVSRVTRGLVELDRAPIDITHIITDAVEQVTPLVQSRRHELSLRLSPESALVNGDKKRLVQVIANILNNSAKYTSDGGKILLKTEVQPSYVLIEVTDNGIGMAPDLLKRAFNLFEQAERTSDRSSGGLGLGLALVKSLVELHGGTISCTSAGVGTGSSFCIRLPRVSHAVDKNEKLHDGTELSRVARPLHVMVVDDNQDAASMLSMLLEALGHHVVIEHSAHSALERTKKKVPDVYLLDIGLPEMDGNELAQRLRAQPETVESVLIAVTGYGQENDRTQTAAAGFDHHLVKPVDIKRLMAILADIGSFPRL